MNQRRTLLSILGLVVLVWLVAHQFRSSPEWKDLNWATFWAATRAARGRFILLAIGIEYGGYLLRALRWRVLMGGEARFWTILKGTLLGFSGVALLGRPGELIRPYYIARRRGTTLPSQLAIWVLERVLDISAVILLVGIDLAVNPSVKELAREGDRDYYALIHRGGLFLGAVIVSLLVLLVLFNRYAAPVAACVRNLRGISLGAATRLERFIHTLASGMNGLTRLPTLLFAILLTVLMWMGVALSLLYIVRSYPNMLPGFSFAEAVLLMGFTLAGSIVQLPAIGGGVQVLTVLGLTEVFGADAAPATSAALLIWLVLFYAIVPFGVYIAAREGVSWRKLEAVAASPLTVQGEK
ncbi:MAG: lysylphosphatidylglycerol synthase transmembrane domain-containing protein [Terriglobales bacterium]